MIDDAFHRSIELLPAVAANVPAEELGRDAGRLQGIRRRSWADSQFRLMALAGLDDVLGPLGVEPIVTKGAALLTTVYSPAGIRSMADVDVVVGADRFDEAMAALIEAGWRRPQVVDSPFDHAVGVFDPLGRAVDLHRWVLFPRFSAAPELTWMERAVPHVVAGREMRRFTCADELVLTVLHGLLTNSSSAVRWPIDVVQMARNGPGFEGQSIDRFWQEVVASATGISAGPILAAALEMCRVELEAPVPATVVRELEAAPFDRSLARHWALCRRGLTLEWRIRRYVQVARSAGLTPTIGGYLGPRLASAKARGLGSVMSVRVDRVKQILAVQRRD